MASSQKVLVGLVWHEGHSFNPIVTRRADFQITKGDGVLAEARAASTSLSGIVKVAEAKGYECVPVIAARARPGGPVEEAVLQEIFAAFEVAARKGGFDAICLDLHGATLGERTIDPEGELLHRLRTIVGPDLPIVAALDLHAYVTETMVRNATILTGYRTTPHSDIQETGERAMMLLDRLMRERVRPRSVYVRIPFLTRGNDETATGPMAEIGGKADDFRQRPAIAEISIFNIHPFLDVPMMGQVVLAYDDGGGAAEEAARTLSEMLWRHRSEFQERLTSVEEALTLARSSAIPLALGDQGDRVVGAGPGDSPEIARIADEKFPDLRIALPIFDPAAVAAAREAGEGAEVEMPIGGSITPSVAPLRRKWHVAKLRRAEFTNRGPYFAGTRADFGDAAVLVSQGITAIVTTQAPNVHDPAFYEDMGVPVATQNVVVARAANHYKLSFADIARTITVDTPGLTAFRPHEFAFSVARPFYPLDDVEWTFEQAATFVESIGPKSEARFSEEADAKTKG